MPVLMQIALVALYLAAGTLLAIPYCLLAGWSAENFPWVVFVAPAFLYVWYAFACCAGIIEAGPRRWTIYFDWRAAFGKGDRRMLPESLPLFWAWTLYSFLPVILHWGAVLLGRAGYETVALSIDTHRFASPLYIFVVALMLLILIGMVTSAWETTKNAWMRIVRR